MRDQLVRFILVAALLMSGASLLPALPRQPAAPVALPVAADEAWNSIALPQDRHGQFRVQAFVNGVPVEFMVDTGASDIVLAPADAARLGFGRGQLRFSRRARTANGDVGLAPVTLREIRIGQLSRQGVPAVVNAADMPFSLLGMSFLATLESWEARGDRLMLYW